MDEEASNVLHLSRKTSFQTSAEKNGHSSKIEHGALAKRDLSKGAKHDSRFVRACAVEIYLHLKKEKLREPAQTKRTMEMEHND